VHAARRQEAITRFQSFNKPHRRRPLADDVDGDAVPEFLNGRSLRDYQLVSLAWMVNNWRSRRNCILGDEMCETGVCVTLSS
jgi:SNF2 family DNA or RNA helicase